MCILINEEEKNIVNVIWYKCKALVYLFVCVCVSNKIKHFYKNMYFDGGKNL